MKKILLTLALALVVTGGFAEEVAKKPSCKGFVTNRFWDNWEISAGAGVGMSLNNGKDFGKVKDRLGWVADFSATKWVHPIAGVRLQLQGGNFKTYNNDNVDYKWPYVFLHTDFMLNFSNWVGGYREDRVYYGVPFAGFGYMAGNITEKSRDRNNVDFENYFAFTMGWLNKFRVCKAIDINLELKTLLVPSQVNSVDVSGNYTFGLSATAGLTYRFNKRDWKRCNNGYSPEDIQAFQDAVAAGNAALLAANAALLAANADNDRLNKELADARKGAPASAKPMAIVPKTVILYDIADAELTDKERTRLDMLALDIKNGSSSQTYSIIGYADQETGTADFNKQIAEERAKAAYDYLVSKGVDADQLTYEGRGNDEDMTSIIKGNRAVIIK